MRHLDREPVRPFIVTNAFSKRIPERIPVGTWLWQVMVRNGIFLDRPVFLPNPWISTRISTWMNVSNRMGQLFDHLDVSSNTWNIFHYPCIGCKKMKLHSKNIMKINMDVFWSTTINFHPIHWHEGSIYVSGTPFDHSESTKDPVCVRKSSQSKASELKTARENLFLSTQRDSVDENRSKNAPSGQNND